MPFVRIDLARGKPAEYRKTLGEIVYQAMIDVINVPIGVGAPRISTGTIIASADAMLAASATGDGRSAGRRRNSSE
jgi:hypothetical protein